MLVYEKTHLPIYNILVTYIYIYVHTYMCFHSNSFLKNNNPDVIFTVPPSHRFSVQINPYT